MVERWPSISRYSKPSSPTRMRRARSRYAGSRYVSHRSGGSRMWPSQSITSASVVITFSSGRLLEPIVRVSTEVHHSRASNAAPSRPRSGSAGQCPPFPEPHFDRARMLMARSGRRGARMIVHLIDGTYELFRHFYGARHFNKGRDRPLGAVVGVLNTVLEMIEKGATHLGVATDHVIESFRTNCGTRTRRVRVSSQHCWRSSSRW